MFKGQEYLPSSLYNFPQCLAWCSTEWIFNQGWQTRGHRGQVRLSHRLVKGEKAPKRKKLSCYFQLFEGWAWKPRWKLALRQGTKSGHHSHAAHVKPSRHPGWGCCIIWCVPLACFWATVQSEAEGATWATHSSIRSIPRRSFLQMLGLCCKSVAFWFIEHPNVLIGDRPTQIKRKPYINPCYTPELKVWQTINRGTQ